MSQYLSSGKHFELSEKIAKAIAEHLNNNGADLFPFIRMSLAEHVVDEIDDWIGSLVDDALDLERRATG